MKEIIENVKLVGQMLIIGALLLYVGSMLFMPDMTVKIFGFQPYMVVTESMEPLINVNDMVVVTKFDVEEAEVGDIITFYADIDYNGTQEVVTHFINEIDTSGEETIIRTNRYFDEDETVIPDTWLIPADDVIGAYGFHVPYVGFITNFVKSIYGIAVIGINVAIFVAIKFMTKKKDTETETEMANPETPSQNAELVQQV
jgi:signal peptidase